MIEINNLTRSRIDKGFLKKVAIIVLGGEKKKEKDLSIALVGQKRIKELNRKYRKKNRPTDVLAFPQTEIVICPKEVRKSAKRYGLSFKKELGRVLIHGLLHTLGYKHKEMRKKEEKYLAKI